MTAKFTYKVLQAMHKEEFCKTIKSCWVADVKRGTRINKKDCL